mmetsp:Transcript_10837/g.23097  ORF Transcript_10837/g.23097 Transcript_10837/m.23097 type:complete len:317 (-) Transcript_10837:161-1111(-)
MADRLFTLLYVVSTSCAALPLSPGDTIAVIGASGNVGRLVSLRLADQFRVNAVVRNPSSIEKFLNKPNIELFKADLRVGAESLEPALCNANAIVVCTGTTAFPTKAWSKTGSEDVTGAVLGALWESRFSVPDAIATLDAKGYNTPRNVDSLGMQRILEAWAAAGDKRKRMVLMSSIGVRRRTEPPFPILNACGVLDAKADCEEAMQKDALAAGYGYTIVRPGQLFGGPYDNNYYLGTLFQLDKDASKQDVVVAPGDTLVGDTLRSTLAEVFAQMLESGAADNAEFSVVNEPGQPPSVQQLRERLDSLQTKQAEPAR